MPEGPAGFPRITSIGPFSNVEAEQEFNISHESDSMPPAPDDEVYKTLMDEGLVGQEGWGTVKAELIVREKIPESDSDSIIDAINREISIATRSTNIAKASYKYNGEYAIIGLIEVDEEFRHMGIAKELKRRIVDDMASRGIVHAYTVAITEAGEALARSTGFDTPAPLLEDKDDVLYKEIVQ